jgi:pseudo-response regulator 5
MTRTRLSNPVRYCLPEDIIQMRVQCKLGFFWTVAQMVLPSCVRVVQKKTLVQAVPPIERTVRHPSYGFITLPIPVGATMPYHYTAILQPLYYTQIPPMHSDSGAINKSTFQHASGQSNYHQNTSKTSQVDEQEQLEDHRLHHSRQIVRESEEPVDLVRAHVEHVNQSASFSQDVRKGSGCTGSAENDISTNTVVALESGNESGVQNCGYNVLDSDQGRREAALIKFRMKRKDRCFGKKVCC